MNVSHKKPSLIQALLPIFFLVLLLFINVKVFGDGASYGPNQVALLLAACVATLIGLSLKYKWREIQDGIVSSIGSAMSAILILLLIGALTGSWLISGIVPAMIYYGLEILSPTYFLVAACIVSSVVSIATGSSWTTSATIGIALIGIGQTLGINQAVIAGAVISGAYFGDKMSPMSDTTNLAPAMAGTDLFTHIRYMALTTIPSISITLIIFLIWGFFLDTTAAPDNIAQVQSAIADKFFISPVLFLVPVAVVFLIVKKMPALPAIFIGTLLGGLFAVIFQPEVTANIAESEMVGMMTKIEKESHVAGKTEVSALSLFAGVTKSMFQETKIPTGLKLVDSLLKGKGMQGMLDTIWLIICAMIYGGVLETCGILKRLADSIIKLAHSTGSLVASTAAICFGFNLTASDQYIAIVVPGRMFKGIYKERGLAPENLSRTLEDTGTVTSVLIPWNTCGAYQSSVLNVGVIEFLPYCFFNIISPFMTIVFAYLGIKIKRTEEATENKSI